jgi:uncharacterized protein (DUF1501 family)
MSFSRRQFLKGVVVAGFATLLPTPVLAQQREKTLIMIHLNGGNDGLNTVIPYRDPLYKKLRPTLAIPKKQVLALDKNLAFHPAMSGMREIYEQGDMGVVLGVGYDKPNLSHFRSTEIWYSGTKEMADQGWLRKAIDCSGTCDALTGVSIGHSPLALSGPKGPAPDLREPKKFKIPASVAPVLSEYEAWSRKSGIQQQVGSLGVNAANVSRRLSRVKTASSPEGPGLARDLRLVLGLLEADLGIRFLHLSMPGFDTHDGQASAHQQLLTRLSQAVAGFQRELERRGLAESVTTVLFSEFGRRPKENSGGGTDHGTAGPLFVIGKSVAGGLHGKQPSLEDLSSDNLKHSTDFRQVYAGLLQDWSSIAPNKVVAGHAPLRLIQ